MSAYTFTVTQQEIDDAVERLDAIPAGDPESSHGLVDDILMELAPAEVYAAIHRVIEREGGNWWFA